MAPELAHALTSADSAQVGARIKAARVAAGLTQPQLAGTDASTAFLSRIETGQRRPSPELLEVLAQRLGVSVDYLVIGDGWEEARRLEYQLDHAELSLVGGDGSQALGLAREVLSSVNLGSVSGGEPRARYLEAAALEALGDATAAGAFQRLLDASLDWPLRLKAATALSRIWREQGQLDRAIACAQGALAGLPADVASSEEGIRLSVHLAGLLASAGRVGEAADLCDAAIAESERLASPVARASAYWNASVIRYDAGDISEAMVFARRALHLLENTERVRDLGRLRVALGQIMLKADPPRIDEAREQLKIAETELDWSDTSPADKARHDLTNARAFLLAGEFPVAEERALAALQVSDGLPFIEVDALALLGQIAWSRGDRDTAQQWYRRAIAELTGVGADREAAQLWFEIGSLAAQAGLVAESADAFRRAAASTGLTARLPVVTQPSTSAPDTTPAATPVGRV